MAKISTQASITWVACSLVLDHVISKQLLQILTGTVMFEVVFCEKRDLFFQGKKKRPDYFSVTYRK